ncbi:hypothetical protein [Streptomyces sp. NPDC052042]|uniref:hypothetical protein n=1 Tax=Streptomyces sp. NPDC052042 TaxID=3365683 RepID=UPI0037CDFE70
MSHTPPLPGTSGPLPGASGLQPGASGPSPGTPGTSGAPVSPPTGRTRQGPALWLAVASVVPAVLGGASGAPATAASSATAVAKPNAAKPGAGKLTAAEAGAAKPGDDGQPGCGDPKASEFPIRTRIHGGPATYAAGGGYGTWFLDLTNTTDEECRAVHPVLVLVDENRKLTSKQIQLVFSERNRPDAEHRVTWETTDQDEHIGVFGDGDADGDGADSFDGFTVPAGRTLTVRVRMAFTSDTSPGRVTAAAAIVQRLRMPEGGGGEDDGEWVGESGRYSFALVDDGESGGVGRGHGGALAHGAPEPTPTAPAATRPAATEPTPNAPAVVPQVGVTITGFLIGGGAAVIWSRRSRRARSGP